MPRRRSSSLRARAERAARGGHGAAHLVKVTKSLIYRADLPTAHAVRDRMLQGAEPASTLLFLAGLASRDWLGEIEAIAGAEF